VALGGVTYGPRVRRRKKKNQRGPPPGMQLQMETFGRSGPLPGGVQGVGGEKTGDGEKTMSNRTVCDSARSGRDWEKRKKKILNPVMSEPIQPVSIAENNRKNPLVQGPSTLLEEEQENNCPRRVAVGKDT